MSSIVTITAMRPSARTECQGRVPPYSSHRMPGHNGRVLSQLLEDPGLRILDPLGDIRQMIGDALERARREHEVGGWYRLCRLLLHLRHQFVHQRAIGAIHGLLLFLANAMDGSQIPINEGPER